MEERPTSRQFVLQGSHEIISGTKTSAVIQIEARSNRGVLETGWRVFEDWTCVI